MSHKEAKPLRFQSLTASRLSEKMYLSPWTKLNKQAQNFHKHKRERRKKRRGKYTGWSANHKAWDYKGYRWIRSQHDKQEASSHNLVLYNVCDAINFTDSEIRTWNSKIISNFLFPFFSSKFGIKLKPAYFTGWQEKSGKGVIFIIRNRIFNNVLFKHNRNKLRLK